MIDVGTTPRRKLSTRARLACWERHGGRCCLCGERIDGARERWIVEHILALELGGPDTEDNMAPAHERCAIEKTRKDHAMAAKAKRMKARHIGARKESSRAMPCGRGSRFRKRMDGTLIDKETGLPVGRRRK